MGQSGLIAKIFEKEASHGASVMKKGDATGKSTTMHRSVIPSAQSAPSNLRFRLRGAAIAKIRDHLDTEAPGNPQGHIEICIDTRVLIEAANR